MFVDSIHVPLDEGDMHYKDFLRSMVRVGIISVMGFNQVLHGL